MCCSNTSTGLISIFRRAILYADFRERFLANPIAVAQEMGLSVAEQAELGKYETRKLKAMVEGPPLQS
jgi:hypothetical protein